MHFGSWHPTLLPGPAGVTESAELVWPRESDQSGLGPLGSGVAIETEGRVGEADWSVRFGGLGRSEFAFVLHHAQKACNINQARTAQRQVIATLALARFHTCTLKCDVL